MSEIIGSGAASRQPKGPARVNPAWAGRLLSLVHFGGGAPYDIVDKAAKYAYGGAAKLGAAGNGIGLHTGAGSVDYIESSTALASYSGHVTVITHFLRIDAAQDSSGMVWWGLPAAAQYNQISVTGDTVVGSQGNSISIPLGESVLGTKNRTIIWNTAGTQYFLDRKKVASSFLSSAIGSGAKTIRIGSWSSAGFSFKGVIGVVAVIKGAISDAEALSWVNNPWQGFADDEFSALYVPFGGPAASGTITTDEIANVFGQPRVFEGASGSRSIAVSGTHSGGTDTIQVQIETDGGAVVVPWQTLQASVADGAFSGTVTVPRGGWYKARTRRANDIGANDLQANKWGVGYVIGMFGQSHLVGFATGGTATPDAKAGGAAVWNGSTWQNLTTAGLGRNTFVSSIVADANCPVCCIIHAVSGTSTGQWWQSGAKTAQWLDWASKVTEAGGQLSAHVYWQGEGNLGYDTKSSYMTILNQIIAQLRTDYGANLPVTFAHLGRHTGGLSTDVDYSAIRDAHVALSKQTHCNGFPTYDQSLSDGTHFNEAIPNAERMAQCVAQHFGDVAYSSGPVILSATRAGSNIVDINLQHFGGSDITPSTGITGFQVLDNGTPVTISSAVRQAANKIRLTLASTPSGTVTVRYGYGQAPDITGVVKDNSGLVLPLITTDADVLAAGRRIVLDCIQRVGGAPAASVTGLRWAFFDQASPDTLGAPAVTGTAESTDAAGALEIDVIGTTLNVGDVGFLVVSDTDGTLADSRGFCGPVQVSG